MRRPLVALGLLALLVTSPRYGGTEPDELPVPVVTLDALPLPIPTAELPEAARARSPRPAPAPRSPSRGAAYRFLLDHPDFAASVARALRLGEYRVTPLEDGYWGDDNRGAMGRIRVLYP